MAFLRAACLLLGAFLGLIPAAAQELLETPPPPVSFESWTFDPNSGSYRVWLPSAVETAYPENNGVHLEVYLPAGFEEKPCPAVLALHFWGASDKRLERTLAQALNERGIAAALMTLPYHIERTPEGTRSGELAIQSDPALLIQTMTQAVLDVRRCLDFLQSRPEIDGRRLGIAGTSLGSIVASAAYAVDPRLQEGAFLLGGVDLAHIFWHSSRVVQNRDALRRAGYTEAKLREELHSIEPLTYLPKKTVGTALVIAARHDTVIPRHSTEALIDALPGAQTIWLDTGHYGGSFVQGRILNEVARYFAASFQGETYHSPDRISAPTIRLGAQYNFEDGFDIGVGIDLWRGDADGKLFASGLLTPRGAQLFIGHQIDQHLSIGLSAGFKHTTLGLFWSIVL